MNNKRFAPVDISQVKTYSVQDRPTRVNLLEFAKPCLPDFNLREFLDTLPHILKANDLRAIVDVIVNAYRTNKPVILGIGGHVIKTGLAPLIITLMEKNVVTALAMNGGASIHDFETALWGRTSEDVTENLQSGMFGMVKETGEMMNVAIKTGADADIGLGEALGRKLIELEAPNVEYSVLATGVRLGIPVTVHVAIGGDTIHMHANADGAALGKTSMIDFRLLTSVICQIGDGGVYLNIGSAVVLPEVFLKALNLARNLSDGQIQNFTTVNMDMIQHYRPSENVVKRPNIPRGMGYSLTGHHEIMVPLLVGLVLSEIASLS